MARVYLDHAATTKPDPRVIAAMLPMLEKYWGNPSSIYLEGQEARRAIDAARKLCADLLGGAPKEIVFTGGDTLSRDEGEGQNTGDGHATEVGRSGRAPVDDDRLHERLPALHGDLGALDPALPAGQAA